MTEYTPPIELDLVRWLAERDREQREIAWDEGLEAGATWTQSTPRGIPVDPPLNPYREGNR